jgi:hypothetical protein
VVRLPIPRTVKANHHYCYKDCTDLDCFNLENENKIEAIDVELRSSKRNIDHVDLLQHEHFHSHSKKIRYK